MSDVTLESQSYIPELLQGVAIQSVQDPAKFAALKVSPTIKVDQETGKINKMLDGRRTAAAARAHGQVVAERSYRVTQLDYECDWLSVGIPVSHKANRSQFDKFEQAAVVGLNDLSIKTEQALKTAVMGLSIWDTQCNGYAAGFTAQGWNDKINGDPVADILAMSATINVKGGRRPNVGLCSRAMYDVLRLHPKIQSNFLYTSGGLLDAQQVAAVLGLEKLVISDAVYDASTGTNAVDGYDVFGNSSFALLHIPQVGLETSALYTVCFAPNGEDLINVEVVPDPLKRRDLIEVETYLDFVIGDASLGGFFTGMLE